MKQDGVRFTCQRGCINCCNQQGFVYLTEDDVKRIAKFTGMTRRAFEAKYIYRTRHQRRFRKPPDKQCPFLLNHGCSIHPAKPTPVPHLPLLARTPRASRIMEAHRKLLPRHRQGPADPNRHRARNGRRAAQSVSRDV